jgi:hypothetical protein
MSVIEDTRRVLQDFLAPEMGAVKARLESLEKAVADADRRAEERHKETMAAIRQVSDYAAVLNRISLLEARLPSPQHQ